MTKTEFLDNLSEKREKINFMHQVISKMREEKTINNSQLDVLLRGYIILIYVLWESGFRNLSEYFFSFFENKDIKVENLPHNLKNEILCSLLLEFQKKEIKNFKCMEKVKISFDNLNNSNLKKNSNLKNFFQSNSNNPKIELLTKFLNKFAFSVEITDKEKTEIEYIIVSRNDIAHSAGTVKNFTTNIKEFLDKFKEKFPDESIPKTDIDFLQDITLDIFKIFKEITDSFEKKYA